MPLDIGIGIIGAIVFSKFLGVQTTNLLILLGVLFALAPDLDFIFRLASGKKLDRFSHEHRNFFHYPLFFIPIGFLALSIFSLNYAVFFAILSLLHLLHDSIGTGWGIQWSFPFSKNYYKFFSDEAGKFAWKIQKWTPEEQNETAAKYGDDNWIRNIYMKINPISVVEYGVLILALIIWVIFKQ